ncbi:Nn.00g107740.m01.CDS01 [Neocucurbitaria sp. VM-36]
MSLFRQQRTCPPNILKAYKEGEYTDLTITCGSLIFQVHQLVVCSACDFFNNTVKFTAGKEAEEKCIDLPEDDPEMIRRLISYLYLGNYDPCHAGNLLSFTNIKQHESTTAAAFGYHSRYRATGLFGGLTGSDQCACLAPNPGNVKQAILEPESKKKPADYTIVPRPDNGIEVENPLTIHAAMYALGDRYQVDGLGHLAKEKFESCLHHHANSEDFVTAVQLAYGATPESNRGLRDIVVKAFSTHFRINITEIPGLEAKLDTIDELSFLLIRSWPIKTEPPKSTGFGGNGQVGTSHPFGSTHPPTGALLFGSAARPS